MIRTQRLILRPWEPRDLVPFSEQNADPVVMQYLGGVLTRAASDVYVERVMTHLATHGFCKWAVEAPGVAGFIGAIGLMRMRFEIASATPVEVSWRLHRHYWGRGYATEAAWADIRDGFERIGLTEIVAITAVQNLPSQRVMERLGMNRSAEFDHPLLPQDSPVRRHVLCRLRPGAGSGSSGA